jgi:phosphoribosylanthranilate isomerase
MGLTVKICGVRRVEDAVTAAEVGAHLIGLNFWPGTPRCVGIEQARDMADAVRGRLGIVAVFVRAGRREILDAASDVGADFVQLHGYLPGDYPDALGDLKVIKAFRVAGREDLAPLDSEQAFAFLLDARVEGMEGGTGRTIDWGLARQARVAGRVLLAGGLTPENVAEAVRAARPWGVDTASGVETEPGVKDPGRVRRFVENARRAAEEMET